MYDVLILDDEPLACAVVTDLLGEEGLSVQSAHDPAEALELLRSAGARVLIVDKHLGPRAAVGGFALAREALRLYPSLGVLYLSSDPAELLSGKTPREQSIPKPFIIDELVDAVQDLLCVEPSSRSQAASERGGPNRHTSSSADMEPA